MNVPGVDAATLPSAPAARAVTPWSLGDTSAAWAALALALAVLTAGAAALLVAAGRPAPGRTASDSFAGFPDPHPSVLVTNPRTLLALELDGFSFGDILDVREPRSGRPGDYHDESAQILARESVPYADLVKAMKAELRAASKRGPNTGVGVSFGHRLFDAAWLTSSRVHFELVGLVNRIDFRSLVPPGCGQTRLVYRLTYRPPHRPQTRLPMTINVIYENRQASCATLASSWLAVEEARDVLGPWNGPFPAARLRNGPLASIDPQRFDRIEVDMQSWRQNSDGTGMDDHAEYVLTGFKLQRGHLVPEGLRNTPSPDLSADQRDALRTWIGEHLDEIDSGAADLPREFLATTVISVTPRGLYRAGNHPFKQLFPDEDAAFKGLPLAGRRTVGSPWMLMRRLDEMTCPGCHQSRTVAGFHLLGEDRTADRWNTMVLGTSEHLREIVDWRHAFLEAAARGEVYDVPVPLAEHVDDRGVFGAHCTSSRRTFPLKLDGRENELPDWGCGRDLICDYPVDGDPVGECVPKGPRQPGDPCQSVTLKTRPGLDGDEILPDDTKECGFSKDSRCEPNHNGFSGGMCSADCEKDGDVSHGATCVKIPHSGFEIECFKPGAVIEKCLQVEPNFSIELMRGCSRTEPCRDDFVCARTGSAPPEAGVCVPPYFIFQARVDGPPKDR